MVGLVWFYGISTIVRYLMPNPFLYIHTLDIYGLVRWYINHCRLFNVKYFFIHLLNIYI